MIIATGHENTKMINEVYLHISSHDKAMQLSEAIETNACGSMFVTHKMQEELKKETDIFNYINNTFNTLAKSHLKMRVS